jgi:hypothetical protein
MALVMIERGRHDSVQFAKVGLKKGDSVRATPNPFDKKMVLIPLNFSRAHWNSALSILMQ